MNVRTGLAAIAVVASAAGMSACSGSEGGGPATAEATNPSTGETSQSPSDPEWDTTYATVKPDVAREAAQQYGEKGAADGTAAAVDFVMAYAFDPELTASPVGENEDAALALTRDMTEVAARDWARMIEGFNSGPEGRAKHSDDVVRLTLYSAWSPTEQHKPNWATVQTHGPATVNPRIKSVRTTLSPNGRLEVHVKSSASVRLVVKKKPVQLEINRDQTLWMAKTSRGWKVDGWHSSLKAGQYEPEV